LPHLNSNAAALRHKNGWSLSKDALVIGDQERKKARRVSPSNPFRRNSQAGE
jgi:hypothetical protein